MSKSYSTYMHKISPEELYEGLLGYGVFSEKLSPIFLLNYFMDILRADALKKRDRSRDYGNDTRKNFCYV